VATFNAPFVSTFVPRTPASYDLNVYTDSAEPVPILKKTFFFGRQINV
jgi:hypothetical protein